MCSVVWCVVVCSVQVGEVCDQCVCDCVMLKWMRCIVKVGEMCSVEECVMLMWCVVKVGEMCGVQVGERCVVQVGEVRCV